MNRQWIHNGYFLTNKEASSYQKDPSPFNTWRPRQNGRYFAEDIFKCIFLNENIWISIKMSPKFVPKCSINNILELV